MTNQNIISNKFYLFWTPTFFYNGVQQFFWNPAPCTMSLRNRGDAQLPNYPLKWRKAENDAHQNDAQNGANRMTLTMKSDKLDTGEKKGKKTVRNQMTLTRNQKYLLRNYHTKQIDISKWPRTSPTRSRFTKKMTTMMATTATMSVMVAMAMWSTTLSIFQPELQEQPMSPQISTSELNRTKSQSFLEAKARIPFQPWISSGDWRILQNEQMDRHPDIL